MRVPIVVLLLLFVACGISTGVSAQSSIRTKPGAGAARAVADPQKLFAAGEAALRAGRLDEAERNFQQVLAINPGVAGAYANLGVIHMRRKQWVLALAALRKAEKLAPNVAHHDTAMRGQTTHP